MRIRRTFMTLSLLPGVLICFGCQGARLHSHSNNYHNNNPDTLNKVTVRFVAPPDQFAYSADKPVNLAADDTHSYDDGSINSENSAFHVVLWGGDYYGSDVTYAPASLPTGPYMFGLFDPDRGGCYQGWMSVNTAGDNVLGALEDWRESVRNQQQWLAYESKISGHFENRNEEAFESFESNLQELRRLEQRIANAIQRERREAERANSLRNATLAQAEVLLVPGGESFMRPWTRPTFSEKELSMVQAGTPLTKFVLVGDYETATGKLDRIAQLRDDLERNRHVFNEELRRLEHRRRYYMLTDHIYNHGDKFVENEKRLQEARGMIARLDHQVDNYNRKFEAVLFVTGLFAPTDALAQFDAKRDALNRDRAVVEARINQIEAQIAEVSERSDFRVRLEQKRQDAFADRRRLDDRVAQIDNAQYAVRELRDATDVIHRHGPASIVTATMIETVVPPRFSAAVEKESLMTVRLQASDTPHSLDNSGPNRTTSVTPVKWGQSENCDD